MTCSSDPCHLHDAPGQGHRYGLKHGNAHTHSRRVDLRTFLPKLGHQKMDFILANIAALVQYNGSREGLGCQCAC